MATDLPHLIPVAMDVKGDYRLSVVLFDDLNRQDLAIHVLGNRNADTQAIAEEIARRCNNWKEPK